MTLRPDVCHTRPSIAITEPAGASKGSMWPTRSSGRSTPYAANTSAWVAYRWLPGRWSVPPLSAVTSVRHQMTLRLPGAAHGSGATMARSLCTAIEPAPGRAMLAVKLETM